MIIIVRRISIVVLVVALGAWYWPQLSALMSPRQKVEASEPVSIEQPINRMSFSYPTLGIEAPLIVAAGTDPMKLEHWDQIRQALRHGVNLTFAEPQFDQTKSAFLLGHSSDSYPHAYSAVFARLGKSEVGDQFTVTTDQAYRYKVVEKVVLAPNDRAGFEKLQQYQAKQRVILVTCWPVFSAAERLAVVGERL